VPAERSFSEGALHVLLCDAGRAVRVQPEHGVVTQEVPAAAAVAAATGRGRSLAGLPCAAVAGLAPARAPPGLLLRLFRPCRSTVLCQPFNSLQFFHR
jgi:hypothetical protein